MFLLCLRTVKKHEKTLEITDIPVVSRVFNFGGVGGISPEEPLAIYASCVVC